MAELRGARFLSGVVVSRLEIGEAPGEALGGVVVACMPMRHRLRSCTCSPGLRSTAWCE